MSEDKTASKKVGTLVRISGHEGSGPVCRGWPPKIPSTLKSTLVSAMTHSIFHFSNKAFEVFQGKETRETRNDLGNHRKLYLP